MGVYKRGKIYWYKFAWKGETIRHSTRQKNDKVARQIEAAHRTSLANGEVGIREKKTVPTLLDFLKKEFLPYVDAHFADAKPKTKDYYYYGVELLLSAGIGRVMLNEITSQHGAVFA